MKKSFRWKNYVLLLIVVSLIATGCSTAGDYDVDSTDESQEQQTSEKPQTEQTQESSQEQQSGQEQETPTEPSGSEEKVPDDLVTKTEYGENGSVSVTVTNSAGEVITRIDYDPVANITVRYEYEYNPNGVLLSEFYYEGNGNLVDEFAAGNYDNITGFGENHYELPNDYDVDIAHAFDVTIEELAPLYAKAEDIWDTYGVAVLIADKVSSYTNGAEKCYDYKQIERCLKLIESVLACYPKDFFRDFSDQKVETDICIQLVGTGAAAGLYIGGYEHLILQIDVNCYAPEDGVDDKGAFFCYTLHHEISHMITAKLFERAEKSDCPLTEEKWNSYNPKGFEYVGYYNDEKESELYCAGTNFEYFISSYGCSTPDEDRAMIFGEAMNFYQGFEGMPFNEKVDAKLAYLSACIRAGFDSADWPKKAPWEDIIEK